MLCVLSTSTCDLEYCELDYFISLASVKYWGIVFKVELYTNVIIYTLCKGIKSHVLLINFQCKCIKILV